MIDAQLNLLEAMRHNAVRVIQGPTLETPQAINSLAELINGIRASGNDVPAANPNPQRRRRWSVKRMRQ